MKREKNKDFKTADKIRDQLIEKNILLKDGAKGTDWELIEMKYFSSYAERALSEYGIRKGLWLSVGVLGVIHWWKGL